MAAAYDDDVCGGTLWCGERGDCIPHLARLRCSAAATAAAAAAAASDVSVLEISRLPEANASHTLGFHNSQSASGCEFCEFCCP
jgi:hypothetical protein